MHANGIQNPTKSAHVSVSTFSLFLEENSPHRTRDCTPKQRAGLRLLVPPRLFERSSSIDLVVAQVGRQVTLDEGEELVGGGRAMGAMHDVGAMHRGHGEAPVIARP